MDWIDRSLETGSSVIIATHEIEPFVPKAMKAVTVRQGKCQLYEPLPEEQDDRIALLESLSR